MPPPLQVWPPLPAQSALRLAPAPTSIAVAAAVELSSPIAGVAMELAVVLDIAAAGATRNQSPIGEGTTVPALALDWLWLASSFLTFFTQHSISNTKTNITELPSRVVVNVWHRRPREHSHDAVVSRRSQRLEPDPDSLHQWMPTDLNRDRHTEPFERASDSCALLPPLYNDDHHRPAWPIMRHLALPHATPQHCCFPASLLRVRLLMYSLHLAAGTSPPAPLDLRVMDEVILSWTASPLQSHGFFVSPEPRHTYYLGVHEFSARRSTVVCGPPDTVSYRCYLWRQCNQLPSAPWMRKSTAVIACAARGGKMVVVSNFRGRLATNMNSANVERSVATISKALTKLPVRRHVACALGHDAD